MCGYVCNQCYKLRVKTDRCQKIPWTADVLTPCISLDTVWKGRDMRVGVRSRFLPPCPKWMSRLMPSMVFITVARHSWYRLLKSTSSSASRCPLSLNTCSPPEYLPIKSAYHVRVAYSPWYIYCSNIYTCELKAKLGCKFPTPRLFTGRCIHRCIT